MPTWLVWLAQVTQRWGSGLCGCWDLSCQVPLPGHYVERIAVGLQHIAALAGPLDRRTGRAEVPT
jgi:hypothetical protein